MDWLFRNGNGICGVRVAGIALKDNKILVQKNGENEYALLGGHLQFGETTEETLVREYREELGTKIICRRLLWTEENFWKWGEKDAHQIGFYYLIDLCDDTVIPDGFTPLRDNSTVAFGWLSLEDLKDVTIYPQFLKKEILDLADYPKHFIRKA